MNRSFAVAVMVLSTLIAIVAGLSVGIYGIVAAGCFCYVMVLCSGRVGGGDGRHGHDPAGGTPFSHEGRSLAGHYERKAEEKIEKKQPSDPRELRLWKVIVVIYALGLIALGFGIDVLLARGP